MMLGLASVGRPANEAKFDNGRATAKLLGRIEERTKLALGCAETGLGLMSLAKALGAILGIFLQSWIWSTPLLKCNNDSD